MAERDDQTDAVPENERSGDEASVDESPEAGAPEAPEPEAAVADEASAAPPDESQAGDAPDEPGVAPAPEADQATGDEAPEEARDEEAEPEPEPEPVATIVDLAADARYSATGKRKTAVARVILRPGSGSFDLNGRPLDHYFPRRTLQEVAKQPLAVTGLVDRVDIRARIHGGGISSQADALRHGIAKALIEADPNLRGELKRRQLLTRDPRVKERRKAGLKKARKRPQFSKR
jgi:small subunit ribosomal protein S9